jgi:hypothetical protein
MGNSLGGLPHIVYRTGRLAHQRRWHLRGGRLVPSTKVDIAAPIVPGTVFWSHAGGATRICVGGRDVARVSRRLARPARRRGGWVTSVPPAWGWQRWGGFVSGVWSAGEAGVAT